MSGVLGRLRRGGRDVTLIVHRHEVERVRRQLEPGAPAAVVPMALRRLREDGFLRHIHLTGEPATPRSAVAILHVDATRVPAEYARFGAAHDRCINGSVLDISKRTISDSLVGDGWSGRVIAKSDLNAGGRPEVALNLEARRSGATEPFPGARFVPRYRIYQSPEEVPAEVRADPALVLERFLPERDPGGFAIRHWIFCGDRGYCNRYVATKRVIKGADVISKAPVPVPEELRSWRDEHGFEIGKLDFVVHRGRTVLIDANKTPGPIPLTVPDAEVSAELLTSGLARLIGARR